MYNKPMLSRNQCQAAIDALIADFNKDPNRRPVDMAIVDDMGNLLAYARLADFKDPQLIALQSGLVIETNDRRLLGSIGVGGLASGKADEDIARTGLKALGKL